MKAPSGLGAAGKALWKSITTGLDADDFELDEREVEILKLAARQADDLTRLDAEVKRAGTMVPGSADQPVLNPALVEARQGRLALNRLLGQLGLPDAAGVPATASGRRAKHAADRRWNRGAAA